MTYGAPDLTRRRVSGAIAIGFATAVFGCERESVNRKTVPLVSLQAPWINDAEFIGYFIAIERKYYEEEGVRLDYLPGGPEKVADQVLLARKADVALTNPETTISLIRNENAPFKIIGTQYQKSPLGVVTLKKNGINEPKDLIGKRLAVPAANKLTVDAFLRLNGINTKRVSIVPYAYDPKMLVRGQCDATIDFVTNVPYAIRELREEPSSFLLYDFGFKVFMDTVVVREETLKQRRDDLVAFMRASRRGWQENFRDADMYPSKFMSSFFKGTGRTVENERYFNRRQQELIESPQGIFSMTEEGIKETVDSLNRIGIEARRDMFVLDILDRMK